MALILNGSSILELLYFIPWAWNRPQCFSEWGCQIKCLGHTYTKKEIARLSEMQI